MFLGVPTISKRIREFQMTNVGGGILWCWPSSLPKHYTINSLSNVCKISQKVLMVYLYIFTYIKSHRWFLFQQSNSEKTVLYGNIHTSFPTCKHQSHDLWQKLNESSLISCKINCKYIDSTACLRSRNHVYLVSYMYFIILGGWKCSHK